MQAVVVTFDRLATSALGCYGNEWIETQHFDRLVTRSATFDRHYAEHVGVSAGMGWSTGRLPADASPRPYEFFSAWSAVLEQAGVELHLLNEFDILPWSMALRKASRTLIGNHHDPNAKPDEIPFACLVKAARELLAEPRGEAPRVVWLHSAGIPEPWLPPEGFATLYFEDFAERGYPMPSLTRDDWGTHPAVYAGYVSLIDHWLGELVSAVEATATHEPTLLIVAAARGSQWMTSPDDYELPASENSQESGVRSQELPDQHEQRLPEDSGTESEDAPTPTPDSFPSVDKQRPRVRQAIPAMPSSPLADTLVRTPLLVRLFDQGAFASEFAGTRCNRLVQTVDLPATLLDFFLRESADSSLVDGRSLLKELAETEHHRLAITLTDGAGWRGIRATRWYGHVNDNNSSDGDDSPMRLFAKPEDQCEINDLSGQQRELTASLKKLLDLRLPAPPSEPPAQ